MTSVAAGAHLRRVTAAERIRARITELEGIRDRYLAYQQDRVNERDHHGAWDVAINLSETESELAGLNFALEIIGQRPAPAEDAAIADCLEFAPVGGTGLRGQGAATEDFLVVSAGGGPKVLVRMERLAAFLDKLYEVGRANWGLLRVANRTLPWREGVRCQNTDALGRQCLIGGPHPGEPCIWHKEPPRP